MYTTLQNSQHNLKIIRRFNEDIWGTLALADKPSSVLNYVFDAYQNSYKHRKLLRKRFFFLLKKKAKFRYKVVTDDKEFKQKRRSTKRALYLSMLKLRRFYGNLGKRKFKRVFNQKGLHTNALGRSFAYHLESRLDVILYRANFCASIFTARQFIGHRKVFVNGILVTNPGLKVFINDFISISHSYTFYRLLSTKLKRNRVLTNYPSYLEVDYKLGVIILTKIPQPSEVPFPFFMDLEALSHNFLI